MTRVLLGGERLSWILPRKLPLRSWSEIRFRLRQELTNLRYAAIRPHLPARIWTGIHGPLSSLPDPAEVAGRLNGTPFAFQCLRTAGDILEHRFPILGVTLETGPDIHWRRDYAAAIGTEAMYFRRIPYLDVNRAGDHKKIWEINRHQHLVLLAQAWLLSGRKAFLDELVRQLESWFEQNPFQLGINWASALEVAFRALSWIWVYHLAGDAFDETFRHRFLQSLYQHGLHLEVNLSYYFSPNTHLLGEAVALHALGHLFPQFPRSGVWRDSGARVVRNELDRQVLADGCHFERSTYYHVYALDMFLFHAVLRGLSGSYREKLTRMAGFLNVLIGSPGDLPFIGDDDGGRFFHPYGPRNRFGLATLATCGVLLDRPEWIRDEQHLDEQAVWWLKDRTGPANPASGPWTSTRFAASGLVVMAAEDVQLIVDAGTFGPGSAGHSHADTLSLVLRRNGENILIDPGTYTYVADPVWRDRFRGTAAHNTIRVDGADQALPRGPFGWQSRPEVEVLEWKSSPACDKLTAVCSYAGCRHQRRVVFDKAELWIAVVDRVEGPPGEHRIEQYWHLGARVEERWPRCWQAGERTLIAFAGEARLFEGGDYGWIAPAFGVRERGPVLCLEQRVTLPATLATIIDLSGRARRFEVRLREDGAACVYEDGAERVVTST